MLKLIKEEQINEEEKNIIIPLTSPGEGVSVFTSPYLSAGAPALGEAKGLICIDIPNRCKKIKYLLL